MQFLLYFLYIQNNIIMNNVNKSLFPNIIIGSTFCSFFLIAVQKKKQKLHAVSHALIKFL